MSNGNGRDRRIDTDGEWALEVERLGLLARQARLDAVLAGKAEVAFPPDLLKKAGRPAVDRMLREEQALFDARLHSMTAEIDALTQAKKLALNQVDTLNTKADLLANFGKTKSVVFDSGYETWLYQSPAGGGRYHHRRQEEKAADYCGCGTIRR